MATYCISFVVTICCDIRVCGGVSPTGIHEAEIEEYVGSNLEVACVKCDS